MSATPQSLVEVSPLVGGYVGGVDSDDFEAPDPADHGQESVAVLVHHPYPHRLVVGFARHRADRLGESSTEDFGGFGVFFDMALARDPALATQAPDEFAHPAFAQLPARALLDPRLGVARLPELPAPELIEELFGKRTADGGFPRSVPVTVQQGLDSAFHNPVAVGEDGLPADPSDLHDFGHRVFVLRDQAHDKKPLARPVGLGVPPGFFDLFNN